jgi:translation initiation factor 2-alpha kinase 4
MYSLGIIFFEMSYPPMMGMQRALVLDAMRRPKPSLPPDFKPSQKVVEDIILSLITHNPKDRPSSVDLLKSGKLPVQGEKEHIRRVLAGIKDPTSPYYEELLSTMFSHPVEPAKDYTWDLYSNNPTAQELLHQEMVQKTLTSIFRRHGGLNAPRTSLYPLSPKYAGTNVVKLLDTHGIVHQLPFDLMMGHARMLAKHSNGPIVQRTFTFAPIYRGRKDTGQPHSIGEVDFDIVTTDTLDLALKEAEVIKVLDEIVAAFPALSSSQMCFHIGHSDLLQLIFEYCRVEVPARRAAADVLSKLNIHSWTWPKIRAELRSPAIGISATSVDELARFDFRGKQRISGLRSPSVDEESD